MLDEAVAGNTGGHPILPALADTISRFEIPTRYFHDLILGAEMDLTIDSYATFDRLSEYCYRVAGTVGLTCLHVFGFPRSEGAGSGRTAGARVSIDEHHSRRAHATTKWGASTFRRRIWSVSAAARRILRGPVTPPLRSLLEFEAERAWRFYEEGAPLVHQIDADSRATLWALIRTYSTLLARIEERDFDVFSSRISLVERGKNSISPYGGSERLVEEGCPRKAFW